MQSAYLWQLWPGRHWPFSAKEEKALLAELKNAGGDPVDFDRGDVTAVLNMIRLGISFAEVREPAPGLQAQSLLSAYHYLDERRMQSVNSFEALLANPTEETLALHERYSSRLVPIPTFWVSRTIREAEDPAPMQVARYVHQEVHALETAALTVEHLLEIDPPAEGDPRREEYVSIGRTLYNPYDECLWDRPFYLPPRVGTLMPTRVADLLEEGPNA